MTIDNSFANIDFDRQSRVGFPEVIYCEGKTASQIIAITKIMIKKNINVMGTRLNKESFDLIIKEVPNAVYYEQARLFSVVCTPIELSKYKVAIVCAGTSDIPVADEAYYTCLMLGIDAQKFYDVGVAGIHRLFNCLDDIRSCSVVIAIAGMEGALASVIGGLVDVPVIGVPTSVGYGASFGGLSSLLTMLNSCSSGVSTMNIDNGFGGGYFASTIIRQLEKVSK